MISKTNILYKLRRHRLYSDGPDNNFSDSEHAMGNFSGISEN